MNQNLNEKMLELNLAFQDYAGLEYFGLKIAARADEDIVEAAKAHTEQVIFKMIRELVNGNFD